MQNSYFTTTNTKGQIVIPKKIRDLLGLNHNSLLKISSMDTKVIIEKIHENETQTESNNAYLQILKSTQGSWENEPFDSKRKIELSASKKRKSLW